MEKRDAWRSFTASGKVRDYLVYRQSLDERPREAKEEKRAFFLENK